MIESEPEMAQLLVIESSLRSGGPRAAPSVRPHLIEGGPRYNVLFLCTANSARSIIAEAVTKRWFKHRFRAFSAGSRPAGEIHPLTIQCLKRHGVSSSGLHSKSWNEFLGPGAPAMDFIFTLCERDYKEACPVWPGAPVTVHWGMADPTMAEGVIVERTNAFRGTFYALQNRIRLFAELPLRSLDRLSATQRVAELGEGLRGCGETR